MDEGKENVGIITCNPLPLILKPPPPVIHLPIVLDYRISDICNLRGAGGG